jgi:WD40 repeat protein
VILLLSKITTTKSSLILIDLNEDSGVQSTIHPRNKRDSTASFYTQSSSQDTHSKKAAGNDTRTDGQGATVPTRSTIFRHHPIIRAPQIRCEADQTIFKIHKGVKTFDLCTAKNVLVTGGMDRVVRLWNPYLPSRPVARLRGHNAPVFLVKVAPEDNRIFSISADKTVMVSFFFFCFVSYQ